MWGGEGGEGRASDSQDGRVLVRQHGDLVLDRHGNPEKLPVQRCCAEEVTAFGTGEEVGEEGGLGTHLEPLRVELFQGNCIQVVSLLRVGCGWGYN